MTEFDTVFRSATGSEPFPWQRRHATGEELPELVRVPTGAGKTEAAALGWLWRRRFAEPTTRAKTPRRLVYCLPMRVLVEQTVRRIRAQLDSVGASDIAVHQLMGGFVSRDWTQRPEDDAVIVGTLDQLLSRALMRGYGVSRYAWPIHYALLHNDALWVFDEVQLMGEALATSVQLDGLRGTLAPSVGPVQSVWMSATVDPSWLRTVDRPAPERILTVDDSDRAAGLGQRLAATKQLERVERIDADSVAKAHKPGTLTLVTVNTVGTARDLATRLRRQKGVEAETLLIHSRFRPDDRRAAVEALIRPVDPNGPGRIAVATQVVEAGVDVSAATLFTEAAPWASLVQRFGRCNRRGEIEGARVFWTSPSKHLPYEQSEIAIAENQLSEIEGASVGPDALESLDAPMNAPPRRFVIRRRDFVGLFDTAPDLSGLDLDVQRYIRDGDDLTVSLAWRELGAERPASDIPELAAAELCPVPIGEMREVMKVMRKEGRPGRRVWRFDAVDGEWRAIDTGELRPGDRLLVDVGFGRYEPAHGFDPKLGQPVMPSVPDDDDPAEASDADPSSEERGVWLSVAQHTDGVCATLEVLLGELGTQLSENEIAALRTAARYHDSGKAHPVFQNAMQSGGVPEEIAGEVIAKRIGRAARYERRGFRHELASLLSYLPINAADPLAAYLIASHHGRVRLGARALPGEPWPDDRRAFMLGCWNGDEVPDVYVGGGVTVPGCCLDLSPLELGSNDGETYTDLALTLFARLGPYRLSFLETILRTADQRTSAQEEIPDA
jgi:CRISPR-associated endonuclease/helicase Cas3